MSFFARRPDKVSKESTASRLTRKAAVLEARKAVDHQKAPDARLHAGRKVDHSNNANIRRSVRDSKDATAPEGILDDLASHTAKAFSDPFYELVDAINDVVPIDREAREVSENLKRTRNRQLCTLKAGSKNANAVDLVRPAPF